MAVLKKNKYGTYQIFIGSSSESLKIVSVLKETIEKMSKTDPDGLKLEPKPWNDYFSDNAVMNSTFLEIFPDILEECEFSLFVISQDDDLIKRNVLKKITRDNVWFEAGMFMGKRGKDQTFFFLNSNEFNDIHFPTDISSLTLQGAKWDTEIASLYFKDSKILKKHKNVKDAVKNRIDSEIEKYVKLLFSKVKKELNKRTEVEQVIIITDRNKCFDIGIELVKKSNERLYTTIGFSKSLKDPTKKEIEMQDCLLKKIGEKKTDFRRYFKTSIKGIENQYNEMQKYIQDNSINFTDPFLHTFNFDYLEMIISDNDVLMVFPDYRAATEILQEKVAFGFLIKDNQNLSDVLSHWLMKKVSK